MMQWKQKKIKSPNKNNWKINNLSKIIKKMTFKIQKIIKPMNNNNNI